MSTKHALNQLGFPCYHMDELPKRKNKGHANFWAEVAKAPPGEQHDWQRVFANYSATVDFPSSCVWREQMQAYPGAKVLLTLHPGGAEAWYKSATETIYSLQSRWEFKTLRALIPFPLTFPTMVETLVWKRTLKDTMDCREDALARYQQHIDEVIEAVPENKLLLYSVDQGWQPLCEFLGVDVPDTEFPRVNDTAQIKKLIGAATWAARIALLVAAGIVCALAYGVAQWI